MSPFLRQNLMFAWMGVITIGLVAVAATRASSDPENATFDQITVHRLNVVEDNGNPRVIISDRKEFPGLYWEGKEYKHHSRDSAGFLFFNDDGTEVGGMYFDARHQADQYSASSGILFDQYHQDQTMGLMYRDQNGQRSAGLHVWDRPDQSLFPVIQMSDAAAKAKTPEEKAEIEKKMMAVATSWGPQGERLFAGKSGGNSVVRLADTHGRPRLLLQVDESGAPSVEFLDETGKVIKRIDAK
ncbi:MAG: hypothetical protein WBQ17_16260 [Rhizomicrobium sp.]|jgi:hypothetical protein